jgi:hypothetical protein
MIAALFVATGGCYFGLPDVDPWDEKRDARRYEGPDPVVAHPPCERFGRWAGPLRGQDNGCFSSAIASVRKFGGVLEHPEGSSAWRSFGIRTPPRRGGWIEGDEYGWTCCVEQGHYGHRARKITWLYAVGVDTQDLIWGPSEAVIKPRPGRDPVRERRIGAVQRMSRKQRRATPHQFRDLLLSLVRSVRPERKGVTNRCDYYSTSREARCAHVDGHAGKHSFPFLDGPAWTVCGKCGSNRAEHRLYTYTCGAFAEPRP